MTGGPSRTVTGWGRQSLAPGDPKTAPQHEIEPYGSPDLSDDLNPRDAEPVADVLVEACAELFDGDAERMIADARLGAKVRARNREAARAPRGTDDYFEHAVKRLRAQGLTFGTIAVRLSGDYGDERNAQPVMALARRAQRVIARTETATPARLVSEHSENLATWQQNDDPAALSVASPNRE